MYYYMRNVLGLLKNKKVLISAASATPADDQCSQTARSADRIACEESARRVDIKVFSGGPDVQIAGTLDAGQLCDLMRSGKDAYSMKGRIVQAWRANR
jgi:hypothetical protein